MSRRSVPAGRRRRRAHLRARRDRVRRRVGHGVRHRLGPRRRQGALQTTRCVRASSIPRANNMDVSGLYKCRSCLKSGTQTRCLGTRDGDLEDGHSYPVVGAGTPCALLLRTACVQMRCTPCIQVLRRECLSATASTDRAADPSTYSPSAALDGEALLPMCFFFWGGGRVVSRRVDRGCVQF